MRWAEPRHKIPNLRWWIAGLLAFATAINYLDRQSLPVVITEIQKTIPVSDVQYAQLQFWFLLSYGVMYLVGGRLMDLLRTRIGYTLMIAWWSAANALHGAVSGVGQLALARFALGVGEGGSFPGSAKAVSEWFPAKERSIAFGLFNTGSSAGAVIAPPLIAAIVLTLDWRWVFFLSGGAGLCWAVVWLFLYQPPTEHRRITAEEREYLGVNLVPTAPPEPVPWLSLFRKADVWTLCSAKFLGDSAWYFFIFWLPKYLADARHLNIREIGYYAWIPYAFAGVGSLSGGWLSGYFMSRGWSLEKSRKAALGVGAAMMPVSLLIAVSPLPAVICFFGIAMFGHQFWSTIMQTLPADLFPSSTVGAVSGMIGAAGSFGGMLFNLLAGYLVAASHGYGVVFLLAGLLHPLSFCLVLVLIRDVTPIAIPATARAAPAPGSPV